MYTNVMATLPQHVCTLPVSVHPLLRRENWVLDGIHQQETLWESLQPALRLATQMLSTDVALLWWTHLMFGKPSQAPKTQIQYLARTPKSWNPAALNEVREYLSCTAAGRIRFAFSEKTMPAYGDTRGDWDDICEVLTPLKDRASMEALSKEYRKGDLVVTSYHPAFRDYFVSGTRSLERDLNTGFLLGITIVHEIAHAVHMLRRNAVYRSACPGRVPHHSSADEPFFCDPETLYPSKQEVEMEAELGWCLEYYLFGVQFHADMTTRYGAANLHHRYKEPHPSPAFWITTTSLPFVARFFRQDRWEMVGRRRIPYYAGRRVPPTHFCYPKCGICNYGLVWAPSAALVDWSDYIFLNDCTVRWLSGDRAPT
jgi:hypothetical protein